MAESDASKRIDEHIEELGDWRGTTLGTSAPVNG